MAGNTRTGKTNSRGRVGRAVNFLSAATAKCGERKRFMVLDGNSLTHRAFHAINSLSTSQGVPTNAVFGFANMLLKLIEEEKPDYLAVAFDWSRITFRHERFGEYKAQRPSTPEELRPQFPWIKKLLRAMRIPIFELEGYEADDLIGTLARRAEKDGLFTLVVTGDRDALQLVSSCTWVLLTRKGISDLELYDLEKVAERYGGLSPAQIVDLKALTGDNTDNIPGVPSVGEKTGIKILRQFGSIEDLLERLDEVQPPRLQNVLREASERLPLSKWLATIICEVPLEVNWEECRLTEPAYEELLEVLRELEFHSLINRFSWPPQVVLSMSRREKIGKAEEVGQVQMFEETAVEGYGESEGMKGTERGKETGEGKETEIPPGGVLEGGELAPASGGEERENWQAADGAMEQAIERKEERERVHVALTASPQWEELKRVAREEEVAVFVVAAPLSPGVPPWKGILRGMAFKTREKLWWWEAPDPFAAGWQELKDLLEDETVPKVFYNVKPLLLLLWEQGIKPRGLRGDVMLEAYLHNPSFPRQGLEDLALHFLKRLIPREAEEKDAACQRAEAIWDLHSYFIPLLEEAELLPLYYEVELPLVEVLAQMERTGVKVDTEQLKQMSGELEEQIKGLATEIYALAGEEFNINSTRQLATILFERLKLPVVKKTKTGYSTDAEVLEELAPHHEIVARILEHRQLVKLKSTYVDGLYPLVDPATGKLHTTFNQTVTATGRLSSAEPNLQNIPVRLEVGRRLRKFFVPSEPGWLILAADYSQIELRVLAHFSGDEELIRAFKEDRDIHTCTAAEVFGVPEEEVTREMRRRAKAVNFGIVYGITDFGLARDLGITRGEARRYIERYLDSYPEVRRFMEEVINRARLQGYVTTLLKRRRYIPELFSSNRTVRGFGERAVLNTPIQGSAADIIKLAMLRIARRMAAEGFKARLLLQVHDELIFECPPEEVTALASMVRQEMENAVSLVVPLKVDVSVGPNWYDLEPLEVWVQTSGRKDLNGL